MRLALSSSGQQGVRPPTAQELRTLREEGVVILPAVLGPQEVAAGREALDRVFERAFDPALDAPGFAVETGAAGDPILALPDGSRFATNLLSKEPFFRGLIHREPVIGLVRSLLPDPLLSSLNALEPVTGTGHQTLHRDEGPVGSEGVVTVNSLWVFDDMDAGNGATRYLPGTQDSDELSADDHPGIRYAEVPAGSVIVMNAHMLHAASTNHDGRRRRVVHVYFTRQGRATQTPWKKYVPGDVASDLTPSIRHLLGLGG